MRQAVAEGGHLTADATAGPVIFVSHSCKYREVPGDERLRYARSVLDRIGDELRKVGFTPWVDRSRLRPGDDWDARIHASLNTCAGGVILLDPVVLEESDWVRHEASILANRFRTVPGFRLIPVLLGGAQPEALQHGDWAPIRLDAFQAIEDDSFLALGDQDGQAYDVARRVADAFAGLAPLRADPLLGWWLDEVTELLKPLGRHRLRGAARALRLDTAAWEAEERRVELLAYALLDGDRDTIPEAVSELAPLANEVPDPVGMPLSRKITPLWVRLETVSGLVEGLRAEPRSRRMLIATSDPDLASDIIHRAVYCSPRLRLIRCNGETGESLDQLEEICRRSIARKLVSFGLRGHEAPDVIATALAGADPPPCAVITADGLDENDMTSLADRLGRRFPGVVLVFLSAHPDVIRGLPRVEPPLTKDEVASALMFRCQVLELAGQECPYD